MDYAKFKDKWAALEPNTKRNYIIAGILVGVIVLTTLSPKRQSAPPPTPIERPETEILADDRGAADISSLAAENRTLKSQMAERQRADQQFQREMTSLRQVVGTIKRLEDNPEELARLVETINNLQLEVDTLREELGRAGSQSERGSVQLMLGNQDGSEANQGPRDASLTDPFTDVDSSAGDDGPLSFDPLARIKPVLGNETGEPRQRGSGPQESRFDFMRDSEIPRQPPRIIIDGVNDETADTAGEDRAQGQQTTRDRITQRIRESGQASTVYIPSSSMFGGVLLNGMDAPTGQTSSQQPHPVTIRVTSLAQLPNRFRTNVRDCLVLASGFGIQSSVRVNLRTERLSCVTKSGGIIDVAIEGYISGDDGKVGIRGDLVHRTGALLGRAMVAGLGSGLSEALQPRQINSVRTGGAAGELEFQAPPIDEVLEIGAYKGASNAMQSLSEYYLERASEIFPIIELEPLREVTIHLSAGVTLDIMENGEWEQLETVSRRR